MIDRKQPALLWWAYRHTNGSIQVKRYFDKRDIDEAKLSDFVESTTAPFEADTREAATEIAEARLA